MLCNVLGGLRGFSDVIWKVKRYQREGPSPIVTFTYHSFDGEQGKYFASPFYSLLNSFSKIKTNYINLFLYYIIINLFLNQNFNIYMTLVYRHLIILI